MYPELRVDWIGTGINGRSDDENAKVLERFCPPKNDDGHRHPTLDVIVQVGMAGEGIDAIHVSEITLLCSASIVNRTLQIIGRGSRRLPNTTCHVSFDSSSEFASKGYIGRNIMDAMDLEPPFEKIPDDPDDDDPWPPELPVEPSIYLEKVELSHIDSGDEGVQRVARVLQHHGVPLDYAAMKHDTKHPHWQDVISSYRMMRQIEADEHDERAIIAQWHEKVTHAVGNLERVITRILRGSGCSFADKKELKSKIYTAINGKKKQLFGAVQNDLEVLQQHYRWCQDLDHSLHEKKALPDWLSQWLSL
jgi:hypothetical protein